MARDVTILTEADLRKAVPLDLAAVDCVERAFRALGGGKVVMPPVLSMDLPEVRGEVDVKTAYIPGFDGFAIKVSPGFFDNPRLGLPSLNGLMILFSAKTGLVEALLLDNGYLTDIRTAAAGAVAARHLAPAEVETAGVIGTGAQARLQMRAAHLVRPFRQGLVWGRDRASAETCAAEIAEALGIGVSVAPSPEALVAQAQLVITATPAREPLLRAEWLHSGLHVTSMGSDQAGKNELDPSVLVAADRYVCDSIDQCRVMGELASACAAGLGDRIEPVELGALLLGTGAGRRIEADITVCDLTGTGVQDTAIATLARDAAARHGQGTSLGI